MKSPVITIVFAAACSMTVAACATPPTQKVILDQGAFLQECETSGSGTIGNCKVVEDPKGVKPEITAVKLSSTVAKLGDSIKITIEASHSAGREIQYKWLAQAKDPKKPPLGMIKPTIDIKTLNPIQYEIPYAAKVNEVTLMLPTTSGYGDGEYTLMATLRDPQGKDSDPEKYNRAHIEYKLVGSNVTFSTRVGME